MAKIRAKRMECQECRLKKLAHDKYRKGFPYYKVQYWDYVMKAWRDIQKRYATEKEARKYARERGRLLGVKYRVIEQLFPGKCTF